MDFGIAKLETAANLTSTGLIMGTPNYMSPEQARGLKVDGRADLFSLGCVLYECLAGTRPFQAESVSGILVKILTEEPPPLDSRATGLPPEIGTVLSRAMAKDPSARFASGAGMIEALQAHADGRCLSGHRDPEGARGAADEPAGGAARLRRASGEVGAFRAPAGRHRSGARPGRGARLAPVGSGSAPERARVTGRGGERRRPGTPAGAQAARPRHSPAGNHPPARARDAAQLRERRHRRRALGADHRPVRVEGVEAVPVGSRLTGRVTHAASAAQAAGRGEMTLEFDSLELAEGGRASIRARPLGLRAPASRKKDNALVTGLSEVGAAVGGLIGGRKGAAAGTVVGGTAGVVMVTTATGREVALTARAPLSVELLEPATVSRPKGP